MGSMLPIWLLPLWTLGVPLVWGIVALVQMPNTAARGESGRRLPSGPAATPDLAHR